MALRRRSPSQSSPNIYQELEQELNTSSSRSLAKIEQRGGEERRGRGGRGEERQKGASLSLSVPDLLFVSVTSRKHCPFPQRHALSATLAHTHSNGHPPTHRHTNATADPLKVLRHPPIHSYTLSHTHTLSTGVDKPSQHSDRRYTHTHSHQPHSQSHTQSPPHTHSHPQFSSHTHTPQMRFCSSVHLIISTVVNVSHLQMIKPLIVCVSSQQNTLSHTHQNTLTRQNTLTHTHQRTTTQTSTLTLHYKPSLTHTTGRWLTHTPEKHNLHIQDMTLHPTQTQTQNTHTLQKHKHRIQDQALKHTQTEYAHTQHTHSTHTHTHTNSTHTHSGRHQVSSSHLGHQRTAEVQTELDSGQRISVIQHYRFPSDRDLSLQEALELFKPDFISRSQSRMKRLEHRVLERRGLHDGLLVQEMGRVHKGRNCTKPHTLSDNLYRPRERAISGKEMQLRSRRMYNRLPEVARRRQQERMRVTSQANRLRVEVFKKKLLGHILQRNTD